MITIMKILTPADWEKFKAIRIRGWETNPEAFGGDKQAEIDSDEEYWARRLDNPKRFYMGIEENNKLVSVAGVIIDDHGWTLCGVYTDPDYRGKGLSTRVITECMEEVKRRGGTKMVLFVQSIQATALHLYTKLGFKIIRTGKGEPMGDGKVYDEYFMEREL